MVTFFAFSPYYFFKVTPYYLSICNTNGLVVELEEKYRKMFSVGMSIKKLL
jgi:hypothetical protein